MSRSTGKANRAFLGAIRDLTELKNSQERAVEKQRLAEERTAVLHHLLGGIAGLGARYGLADVGDATSPVLSGTSDPAPSAEVLAGVLVPFEAAFRGYVEANRQLSEQNQALTDATVRADAANRELESFSSAVAHDLRAPLRAIDGFGSALFEDCNASLDEQGRQHLARIRAAARRMSQLIDDLLGLSRISRADLRRTTVDLATLASRVVERLRQAKSNEKAEFLVLGPLCVEADARLLEIVIENLVGNALKFSSKSDAPKIELGRFEADGESVYFVRDNGAGFDPSHASKLFGPFQRLHSQDEFEGTGIGLSTVKRIVERHGGRIWAKSEVGQGATFYFTLRGADTTTG